MISNRTLRLQYVYWPASMFWMYIEFISLYTLPLCLGFYFRLVIDASRTIRYTVWCMTLFVAGLFVARLLGVPFYRSIFAFFQVSLLATLFLLVPIFLAVLRRNVEARLIAGGVFSFLLVALYDLLGVLGYIYWPRQMISYGFAILLFFLALVVSRRYEEVRQRLWEYSRDLENARNELARHATNLEEIVAKRTWRIKQFLERVRWLKRQQDGDYFLIARLMAPFAPPRGETSELRTEHSLARCLIDQKKKFRFRHWREEIGGDVAMANTLRLADSDCIVCVNADAMGKSMQGAGGALIMNVAYRAVLERFRNQSAKADPETWLRECFLQLHRAFLPFEGAMLVTAWLAVLVEDSGELFWINAEHPRSVLLRAGHAEFLPDNGGAGKLGVIGADEVFAIERIQLQPGDTIISGSDGRDDVMLPASDNSGARRVMNDDEFRFLRLVQDSGGDVSRIAAALREAGGELTDDLSLIELRYR